MSLEMFSNEWQRFWNLIEQGQNYWDTHNDIS